ncbi:hypothetical protein U0070_007912, partial [Myodes glareolus]
EVAEAHSEVAEAHSEVAEVHSEVAEVHSEVTEVHSEVAEVHSENSPSLPLHDSKDLLCITSGRLSRAMDQVVVATAMLGGGVTESSHALLILMVSIIPLDLTPASAHPESSLNHSTSESPSAARQSPNQHSLGVRLSRCTFAQLCQVLLHSPLIALDAQLRQQAYVPLLLSSAHELCSTLTVSQNHVSIRTSGSPTRDYTSLILQAPRRPCQTPTL